MYNIKCRLEQGVDFSLIANFMRQHLPQAEVVVSIDSRIRVTHPLGRQICISWNFKNKQSSYKLLIVLT